TAAALHAAALDLPAPLLVRQLPQRTDEIDLLDRARRRIDLVGRLGAAERADQLLLAGMPRRLRAARGTRERLARGDRRGQVAGIHRGRAGRSDPGRA